MSTEERISRIESVVVKLRERRSDIIDVLQWEICKSTSDAEAEFDRTMAFIENTIEEVRGNEKLSSVWKTISGITARVKRAAIGRKYFFF